VPVVNTVAENGTVYPTGNATIGAGNTNAASSALFYTFTLPSAGEWEVNYVTRVSTSLTAGNAGFYVGVFDSGTVVPNTELQIFQDTTIGGTSFPGGTGTGVVKLTTTGAKTYQIRVWENNGIGGQAISDSNGRSYVFYNKIAGQLPSTGTTVDYLSATSNTLVLSFTTNPSTITTVPARSGNIPYNPTTGAITLTAGKTYKLSGSIIGNVVGDANATVAIYFSATANGSTPLVTGSQGSAPPTTNNNVLIGNYRTETVYTPTVTQDVYFVISISGSTRNITGAEINVVQLGSTAITTNTRVNVICRNKTPQVMINGDYTKNTNWTEIQDPTNSFNPVTGVFTAPRTASYAFSSANRTPVVADGGEYGQAIFLNNVTELYRGGGRAYITTDFSTQTNGVINLNAGDIIDVRTVYEGPAGNTSDFPTAFYSWFTITEINPTY
jgi:hypothetical protein